MQVRILWDVPESVVMNVNDVIKVPYTTRPHMMRNDGAVFNRIPELRYLREKKQMLSEYGSDLYGQQDNSIVRRASLHLGLGDIDSIVELASHLEEDVAILHRGVLSAICFCFPSSWVPSQRVGRSLEEIHGPVADGDHLRSASARIAKTISDPTLGSFKRYVWTISRVPHLSNHPKVVDKYRDAVIEIDNLFFRTEIQTTQPLSDGDTCVFFVKVDVVPLKDVWSNHSTLILESINSMSDTILTYKNLHDIKNCLNSMRV